MERFGAFVELGGLDGMVSVAELSWSHVDAISDVVGEGQEVTVEVLDVDMDRERIALSLKALEPDPMAAFARAGFAGIRAGTVTRVLPFGVCVKVAPGVEGLVHEKDLGGLAPREGDELSVEVTSVNLVTRRVALRLRG
ncbi:S1 RNA-binding domain-containing protein [Streptomyces sp. Je 1-79]|nr:S1 RNA-binding domain-containing protein [Streptomyces sp. Je 1-79]